MKLKTSDLMIASVRFYNSKQGILLGYGGSENKVIFLAPKVVLYQNDNQIINLFDPDDQTPVLKRSRCYEKGAVLLKGESLPELGVCYIEQPDFSLFPFGKEFCTLEEIEDKVLSSSCFFYNKEEVIDRKIHRLDTALYNKKIKKKDYENKMFYLLSLHRTANHDKRYFDDVMEKFISEEKLYQKKKY